MSRTAAALLAEVQQLLEKNEPAAALSAIRRAGMDSPQVRNAKGVCLMRLGDVPQAIAIYRPLCLDESDVCLRRDIDPRVVVNYATALALTGNVTGAKAILQQLEPVLTEANALRAAIRRWERDLPWWRRALLCVGGMDNGGPVMLPGPPGVIVAEEPTEPTGRDLRPAA